MHPVIEKARVQLLLSEPFVANILFSVDMVESEEFPTAATDGSTIWVNPKWIDSLPVKSEQQRLSWTKTILAHETYHIAFLHSFRRQERDPLVWNIACDAVINAHLVLGKYEFPAGCVQINGSELKSAEEVYADLMKNAQKITVYTSQNGGGLGNDVIDAKDDPSDGSGEAKTVQQKEMRVSLTVQKALDIAKAQGSLPGSLKRFVEDALEGKVPWQTLLREAVTTIMRKDDYTWSRMNRRFIYTNQYMPGMEGTQCGPLVIAFDTSGSIGNAELQAFLGELNAIFEDVCPESIHVIACDAAVSNAEELDMDTLPLNGNEFSKMMKGGGGTAFRPVFDYVRDNNIPADMIIYFTDLCGSDFGDDPSIPVLWVSTCDDKAPFGSVIKLEL